MHRVWWSWRRSSVLTLAWTTALLGLLQGCQREAVKPVSDVQDRLAKLMNLYRAYVDKNHKGPANEEALREFGQKLSPQERADRLIGDDLESIFTSPRDNQK